jgi:hypothetical protein
LTLASGCGGEDTLPRKAVSGTVTFNGAPLKAGRIEFQPTSANETVAGVAGIVDGRYSIAQADGLVPGKYLVMITGPLAPPAPPKEEMPGQRLPVAPAKELIPAKYNTKSELTAQVTKEGPNTFDFKLTEK